MIIINEYLKSNKEAITPPPIGGGESGSNNLGSNNESNKEDTGSAKDGNLGGDDGTNGRVGERDDSYFEPDLSKLKNFTENPKISYNEIPIEHIDNNDRNKLRKEVSSFAQTRVVDKLPAGYFDNVLYNHRKSILDTINDDTLDNSSRNSKAELIEEIEYNKLFILGDCFLVLPPEFISITRHSSNDSISGVRKDGSVHIKHGYASKDVQFNLVLNGMNQINGYKVKSPFGGYYYVDGLRNLIAQFKLTPFVTVLNTMLNLTSGIYNLAIRNINVETIPGFPECLNVIITSQSFNTEAYTPTPEDMMTECIDWDLYRWHTQKPLVDNIDKNKRLNLKKINSDRLNNEIIIKMLAPEIIKNNNDNSMGPSGPGDTSKEDELYMDLTNDYNYIVALDTKKDTGIKLVSLSFSMENIMPNIQLSDAESPTMQYLGSTDTNFNFSFEVKGQDNISIIENMVSENLRTVRDNRFINGIGFIKVENELVQLSGTEYLLIKDMQVSTIPGFADLFNVVLTCISYNPNHNIKTKFQSFRPFNNNRLGTMSDVRDNEPGGLAKKIVQDCTSLEKLQKLELYKDLNLPSYNEVDNAYNKISKFRIENNLTPLHISKYPRHKYYAIESSKEVYYEGFVDPDFYYYYPISYETYTQSTSEPNELKINRDKIQRVINKYKDNNIGLNVKKLERDIKNIIINNPIDYMGVFKTAKPDIAIEPEYVYGWEPDTRPLTHKGMLNENESTGSLGEDNGGSESEDGAINSGGTIGTGKPGDGTKDPKSVQKVTGNIIADFAIDRANSKCGYLWGAHGQIMTRGVFDSFKRKDPTNTKDVSLKWLGKQVFDCSGLCSWTMCKVGFKQDGYRTNTYGLIAMTNISKSQLKPGDFCVTSSHAAIYIGNNQVAEAANSASGVVIGNLGNRFTHYVRPTGLSSAITKFMAQNPQVYANNSRMNDRIINTIENDYSKNNNTKTSKSPNNNPNINNSFTNANNNKTVLANFGGGNACDKWNTFILEGSKKYNLDPNFIKVIIMIESTGNPNLTNYGSNCKGLMQLNPTYWKVPSGNYYDPRENILVGCKVWDEYRKYSFVGTNKERWLMSYNAGPGTLQSYLNGNCSMPSETRNYIKKYDNYYAKLKANGAKAGNTYTPGGSSTPGNGNYSDIPNEGEGNFFDPNLGTANNPLGAAGNYNKDDFKNKNSGKKHGNSEIKFDVNKAGKPNVIEVSTLGDNDFLGDALTGAHFDVDVSKISKQVEDIVNSGNIAETQLVDTKLYSSKGTLCRAFPTYLLVFIDQQEDWCDKKRIWDNYYVCEDMLECEVFSDYSNPASTLKMSLQNFSNNLTKIRRPVLTSDMFDDNKSLYEDMRKWFYNTTGALVDEKITDKMISLKNILRDDIKLEEGGRIHLRLGYGSNPSRLPTVFNGTITEIQEGEVVSVVAQNDGRELILSEMTSKTSATNVDLNLGSEVSDIVVETLLKRDNEFLVGFTAGNYGFRSQYGIEHFGTWQDFTFDLNYRQYDICKNIYCGVYNARPFYKDYFNPLDGEKNYRFIVTSKTPWDVIKMSEKCVPEFISYYRPFGFDHRIYFGLPTWPCKYEYHYDKGTKKLYEFSKAFSQLHEISGVDSIIDNTLRASSKGHITNAVGLYCLGGDISSTPTIYSDKYITPTRQVTKVIDTSSVQDFGFIPSLVDKVIEWVGAYDNGKNMAINVCISELLDSWKNTYKGAILIIGQPEINVYDKVYLDDTFLNINGLLEVRQVYHSLSVSTGFTTSITPGLISVNTMKTSGAINNIRNLTVAATSIYAGKRLSKSVLRQYGKMKAGVQATKYFGYIKGTKTAGKIAAAGGTKNFIMTNGSSILKYIKKADIVTDLVGFIKKVDSIQNVYSTIKNSGLFLKVINGVKSFSTMVKTGSISLSGFTGGASLLGLLCMIVVDILINCLLGWVIDMFQYKNCVYVHPLTRVLPNGDAIYYLAGHRGSRTLIPSDSEKAKEQGIEF